MQKWRLRFIWAAVVVIPATSLLAPMIDVVHDHAMYLVFGEALFFTIFAVCVRRWFDAFLAGLILASFVASFFLFPAVDQCTLALRTAAILSFVLLNAVLLIGPWSRFSEPVRRIYQYRRHLGVTAYLLAQLHFSLIFVHYFAYSFANTFMALFTFFGFTGYFIMLCMALSSWDWQQKHVGNKRWKQIHFAAFIVYVSIAAYAFWVNISNHLTIQSWQWTALASFLVLWYLMAPWGFAPKLIKTIMGWKQLHTLIHIGYLSVVLHIWFGVLVFQPFVLQATFIVLVSFTWGSHAVGWLIKWREDKALKMREARAKKIQIDGRTYWSVGKVGDFIEGQGKKFLINHFPIAVFRYQEKFFGLYAVCAHQKGPIEKGKIVNGYVECPWHKWQYSCETGGGPPGFPDRLGFYPCVVQDGEVWVSQSPKRVESAS